VNKKRVAKTACKLTDDNRGFQYHLGESHMVHLSFAVAGFDNIHVEHVQLAPLAEVAFIPEPDQSKATTDGAAGLSFTGVGALAGRGAVKSYVGSESGVADLALSRAAMGVSMGWNGDGKLYVGKSCTDMTRTACLGSTVAALIYRPGNVAAASLGAMGVNANGESGDSDLSAW